MPDFCDSELLGLRDTAAVCEHAITMSVGGTHLAMTVMDVRDPFDNTSVFMPLVAALGRELIEELTR